MRGGLGHSVADDAIKRRNDYVRKEKRFNVKEAESYSGSGTIRIIVDTKTGVNYIMTEGVGGSSITPLLDSNGKVVIDN